jgi:catechol 2,3-dioxygenase-like lactoylglutathione lyase family enzyme
MLTAPLPLLGTFHEVSVVVADMRAALEFYERLGFSQATTTDTFTHPYGVVTDGRIFIGLHQRGGPSPVLTFVRAGVAQHAPAFADAGLDENSTKDKNLVSEGFLARTREQELKCATQIADVLMDLEDITAKVAAATGGLEAKAANDKRKATMTQLEQACEQESASAKGGPFKCETVDMYQGGQYWLYKYHRYTDVRLVFAPEREIAAFGGDPDNFQFPRWCLDMSVLRAYGPDGKPAATPNFLRFRPTGPEVNELVFVSGHPGNTSPCSPWRNWNT